MQIEFFSECPKNWFPSTEFVLTSNRSLKMKLLFERRIPILTILRIYFGSDNANNSVYLYYNICFIIFTQYYLNKNL